MTLSHAQLISFLLLIALLIGLTATWLRPVAVTPPEKLPADIAEWFAFNAASTTIDETGQPKHQVTAERLTHYDQLKQTFINEPRAQVFNPDSPPWQLRADKGLALHANALEDMREIDLSGNVIIWREVSKDAPRSEMDTEFLKFFPDKDYVETDQLVVFTHGKHQMSGVGMWADLDTQQVKLLNDIKGKYIRE